MEMELRARIVDEALRVSALNASEQTQRRAMADLFGPIEGGGTWDLCRPFRSWRDDAGRLHTEGVSTCSPAATGICRRAGIVWPWDARGYRAGQGIGAEINFALLRGAWRTGYSAASGIERGDLLVLRVPSGLHICVAIGLSGDFENRHCYTVDGGLVDSKTFLQRIGFCDRSLDAVRGSLHGVIKTPLLI